MPRLLLDRWPSPCSAYCFYKIISINQSSSYIPITIMRGRGRSLYSFLPSHLFLSSFLGVLLVVLHCLMMHFNAASANTWTNPLSLLVSGHNMGKRKDERRMQCRHTHCIVYIIWHIVCFISTSLHGLCKHSRCHDCTCCSTLMRSM